MRALGCETMKAAVEASDASKRDLVADQDNGNNGNEDEEKLDSGMRAADEFEKAVVVDQPLDPL
jgi:hypothetical protein